jgi:hypothetical protein
MLSVRKFYQRIGTRPLSQHTNRVVLGLVVLTVLLCGALVFAWVPREPSPPSYPELAELAAKRWSFDELSGYFTALAGKKGAVYAYHVLAVVVLPPGIDMHLMGHVVGEELYKQEGIEGIKECTPDFRNACSHTIVIGALQEFGAGDATVGKIRAACKQAPGGPGAYTMCYHGLGHGVFAYFGYKIPETVAFCERLGTKEYGNQEYPQCVGGMIMELIDGGGHDQDQWEAARVAYVDPNDPLAPCNRAIIPEATKSFCYTYLTPNLFAAAGANLGNPDPATFSKAFSFCTPIASAALRKVCYGGFGKEFVPLAGARDIRNVDSFSDEVYRRAIGWCMEGPSDEARTACVSQALSSVFWGGENDPEASFRFCSLVPEGAMSDACYADLSGDIRSYTSGDTRAKLCGRLPEAFVAGCGAGGR